MNITNYVRKNRSTFDDSPLNEVDSLVFAELAYFAFSRAQCRPPQKTLGELAEDEGLLQGTLSVLKRSNRHLLKAIVNSPRFAPVKVGYYRSRCNNGKQERFAAVTFRLSEGVYHIAFRGTGVSLVGWKENLSMSLMNVIPTQRTALRYLLDVASAVEGKFTIGGLSKGGNLSVFSATFAPSGVKERIIAVYDHDGPGFKVSIYDKPRYLEIAERVHKTVPHDAIVGMLLSSSQCYEVVGSTGVSIGQHNPFTWVVKDTCSFKKLPKTTRSSRAVNRAFSTWLEENDEATRRKFINALFKVVQGSGAKEVGDFLKRPLHKIHLMRKAFNMLDPQEKQLVAGGGREVLSVWFREIFAFARLRKKSQKAKYGK